MRVLFSRISSGGELGPKGHSKQHRVAAAGGLSPVQPREEKPNTVCSGRDDR